MPNIYGPYIKTLRITKGVKASFIARRMHVSAATYSEIESGKRGLIAERLDIILESMEITMEELKATMPKQKKFRGGKKVVVKKEGGKAQ